MNAHQNAHTHRETSIYTNYACLSASRSEPARTHTHYETTPALFFPSPFHHHPPLSSDGAQRPQQRAALPSNFSSSAGRILPCCLPQLGEQQLDMGLRNHVACREVGRCRWTKGMANLSQTNASYAKKLCSPAPFLVDSCGDRPGTPHGKVLQGGYECLAGSRCNLNQ